MAEIRRAAATGIYDIRGAGAKRALPHLDDLLFLGASISRYPLEGYRERCGTEVVLGDRFAAKPIRLKTPVTIAGMSFGSSRPTPRRPSAGARASPGPRPPRATAA
jgi:glutamate synthase domain-containing protein 2